MSFVVATDFGSGIIGKDFPLLGLAFRAGFTSAKSMF